MNKDWAVTLPVLARWLGCFLVGHKRSLTVGRTQYYDCVRCARSVRGR